MIRDVEIKRKAREKGVPASTIERDYTQSWFLKNFADDRMLLKGGTGIKKVYFCDYRFSDDLDFTLTDDLDINELHILTQNAIQDTERECGIRFEKDLKLEAVQNGIKIEVYFRILRSSGSPLKIKIDLTKPDKEIIVLVPETKKILHNYSDSFDKKVLCYPLEEIIAEKIRAIFERTRPRDLYDIWKLYERVDMDAVKDVLKEKCQFKGISIESEKFIDRKGYYRDSWNSSLEHQMEELPDFETMFDEVVDFGPWVF